MVDRRHRLLPSFHRRHPLVRRLAGPLCSLCASPRVTAFGCLHSSSSSLLRPPCARLARPSCFATRFGVSATLCPRVRLDARLH